MNCYVTTNRLVFILLVIEFLLSSVLCADNSWTKHQFKILIEPQKLECFHQHVKEKALFHVSFQVMKGDVISTYVFDPNRNLLNSVIDQQTGSYQIPHSPVDGNYEVCFDNQNSNFAWKLVSIYILTFEQEILLEKFKEDKEFNETTTIVKESANKIGFNIAEIFTHQALSRFRQTRDDYLIEANNSLVMYWSLAQSIVIVFCGLFQVYFIKRLFSATSYQKSSRSFN